MYTRAHVHHIRNSTSQIVPNMVNAYVPLNLAAPFSVLWAPGICDCIFCSERKAVQKRKYKIETDNFGKIIILIQSCIIGTNF